jgi:hypothetical protein
MNAAIKSTEGTRTHVLRVEWGCSTPMAVEIRYSDDSDPEAAFLNTGYPWESRILHEDLVDAT